MSSSLLTTAKLLYPFENSLRQLRVAIRLTKTGSRSKNLGAAAKHTGSIGKSVRIGLTREVGYLLRFHERGAITGFFSAATSAAVLKASESKLQRELDQTRVVRL